MTRVVTQGRYRVYVYPEIGGRHHSPHCHVEWADGSCVIELVTFTVLAGRADAQALRLVRQHAAQIRAAWQQLNPGP
jgi:Domain of unknown function (DUF4160)